LRELYNKTRDPVLKKYADRFLAYLVASKNQPTILDPSLMVQVAATGLELPTTMAFLGPNDILVLEKDKGTVRRIVDGKTLPEPLLVVNVSNVAERGMLGIAASKHGNGTTYVFLYFTGSRAKTGQDAREGSLGKPGYCKNISDCPSLLGNRLYRYELVNNKLVNPKLLLDLPSAPGPTHNGGFIKIGPDNNLYIIIGDVNRYPFKSKVQNVINGTEPDGTSGILRITQDGKPVGNGIIGNNSLANIYYAYGIRNGFGMDFDPITKILWDTENGPGLVMR
jgi:glucose/arabinose dehydrogenase